MSPLSGEVSGISLAADHARAVTGRLRRKKLNGQKSRCRRDFTIP
jgi:hypothetical protein